MTWTLRKRKYVAFVWRKKPKAKKTLLLISANAKLLCILAVYVGGSTRQWKVNRMNNVQSSNSSGRSLFSAKSVLLPFPNKSSSMALFAISSALKIQTYPILSLNKYKKIRKKLTNWFKSFIKKPECFQ